MLLPCCERFWAVVIRFNLIKAPITGTPYRKNDTFQTADFPISRWNFINWEARKERCRKPFIFFIFFSTFEGLFLCTEMIFWSQVSNSLLMRLGEYFPSLFSSAYFLRLFCVLRNDILESAVWLLIGELFSRAIFVLRSDISVRCLTF